MSLNDIDALKKMYPG